MKKINSITIYSTRGGSGKTLTTLMMGITSAKRGYKTIIIDVDLEAPSLIHLIKPMKNNIYTWVDFIETALDEDNISPDIVLQMINDTKIENLKVIYSPSPEIGKSFLSWKSKDFWKDALRATLYAINILKEQGFDIIIFDNQSGTSLNSINNLVIADVSVMVMRPSEYGLGATEALIKNMYNKIQGMKSRIDYYIWNQLHHPMNQEEEEIIDSFLKHWDQLLSSYGLEKAGLIKFERKLNIEFLADYPNFDRIYDKIFSKYTYIFDKILDSHIEE